MELRDREKRYRGLGVETAVNHVNHKIADRLIGKNALNQIEIDQIMLEADGTPNKERSGDIHIYSGGYLLYIESSRCRWNYGVKSLSAII